MKPASVVPFVKINKVPVYVPPNITDPIDLHIVEEDLVSKKEKPVKQNIMDYADVLTKSIFFDIDELQYLELLPCHIPNVLMIHYLKPTPQNPYPMLPFKRGVFFDIEKGFLYDSIYPWTPIVQATSFVELASPENPDSQYNIEFPPFYAGQENIKFTIADDEEMLKTSSNFIENKYLSYKNNTKYGKKMMENVIINSAISGTVIRILYINGEILFSTHRNSDARNSSWGGNKTFYESYLSAGGPLIEEFFNKSKRYGKYIYMFILMDPSNLVDLPIYIKSSHLFYLGVVDTAANEYYSEDELDSKMYDFKKFEFIRVEKVPFDLESINPQSIMEEDDKGRTIQINKKKIIRLKSMKYTSINDNLFPEGIEQRVFMDKKSRPIVENSNSLNISNPVIILKEYALKDDENNDEYSDYGYSEVIKIANPSVLRRIHLRAQCSNPLDSFYSNLNNSHVQFLINYSGDAFHFKNKEQTFDKFKKYYSQELDTTDVDFPVISALHNFNVLYLTPVEYYDSDILRLSLENYKFVQSFNVFMYGIIERIFEIDNAKIESLSGKQLYIERRNNRTRYIQYVVYLNLLQSLPAGLQEEHVNMLENFYDQIDKTVEFFMRHYSNKAVTNFRPQEFLFRKNDKLGYTDREKQSAGVIAKHANRIIEKAIAEANVGIDNLRYKQNSKYNKFTSSASKNLVKKKFNYETSDEEEKVFLNYLQNNITRKLIFNPSKNAGIIKRVNSIPI